MSSAVGVLGWGAIGSAVGNALMSGAVDGSVLAAVGARRPIPGLAVPVIAPGDLAPLCDVVVEAAGHDAVREHVPDLLRAGCRVLLVSTGALSDEKLLVTLRSIGTGQLLLSSGAIGGIDLLQACRAGGAIHHVRLISSKSPRSLRQDWMDPEMLAALERGDEAVVCFDGPASEAARLFPANLNVSATLAIAAGSWELVSVAVIADPAATRNHHQIVIDAETGHYELDLHNDALPGNPRSSALVVASVLRGLATLSAGSWAFV
jgi:aspartate dehydrogenase